MSDLLTFLQRQIKWSETSFGPGARTGGLIDHIRKELSEIDASPNDIEEWIDVVILGFDGAWRTGATPQQIIDALFAKQAKNEARLWPDWRTVPPGQAIEHDRSSDSTAIKLCPETDGTDLICIHGWLYFTTDAGLEVWRECPACTKVTRPRDGQ